MQMVMLTPVASMLRVFGAAAKTEVLADQLVWIIGTLNQATCLSAALSFRRKLDDEVAAKDQASLVVVQHFRSNSFRR